jgi:hypothetical protein
MKKKLFDYYKETLPIEETVLIDLDRWIDTLPKDYEDIYDDISFEEFVICYYSCYGDDVCTCIINWLEENIELSTKVVVKATRKCN